MVCISYEAALSRGGIVGSPLGMHQHSLSPPLTNLQDRENIRYTVFTKNDFIQVIRESMEQYTVDEAGTGLFKTRGRPQLLTSYNGTWGTRTRGGRSC